MRSAGERKGEGQLERRVEEGKRKKDSLLTEIMKSFACTLIDSGSRRSRSLVL